MLFGKGKDMANEGMKQRYEIQQESEDRAHLFRTGHMLEDRMEPTFLSCDTCRHPMPCKRELIWNPETKRWECVEAA